MPTDNNSVNSDRFIRLPIKSQYLVTSISVCRNDELCLVQTRDGGLTLCDRCGVTAP
jgi:hypothetical protein